MNQKTLIGIDCLLDIVLATVEYMDEDLIKPLYAGGYFERCHNKLDELCPKINLDEFHRLYKERPIEVLKLAKMTNMVNLIGKANLESLVLNPSHPEYIQYDIIVNLYPYNLESEDINSLALTLLNVLHVETIKFTNKSYDELTHKYIKENFDRVILYSYWELARVFEPYIKELEKDKNNDPYSLKNVFVLAPYIVEDHLIDKIQAMDDRLIMGMVAPVYKLQFGSLSEYSISLPYDYQPPDPE